jgi:predicted Zn-dependent protease with MMP-like domain
LLVDMIEVTHERFEELVADALDGIPPHLAEAMSNVAVFVEDVAPRGNLLGLYVGIPLTKRTSSYAGTLPDRIMIYRSTICRICSTEHEVVEQVRKTVVHEVAHHFGINDERLDELGY